jgi:hypothetical protein
MRQIAVFSMATRLRDRGLGLLGHDPFECEVAVLCVDADRVAFLEAALEQLGRDRRPAAREPV